MRWSLVAALLLPVALAAAPGTAGERNAVLETLLSSVTESDLKGHIEFLADDTLEGREAGTRGGQSAGHYLGEQFQKHRLAGGGAGGGYYQPFGAGYRNILGVLEGSDPALRDEIVLLGAHYDHVGYGTSQNSYGPVGFIHTGADDNGSGTATLLEVVEALAQAPSRPPRTVVFALWDAEEKGLLGSKHWVENPTLDLRRVKLAFNIDMLGRLQNRKLTIYGVRTAPGLRQMVSRRNAEALTLEFDWSQRADSDHYSFYEKRIPYLMLFTGIHSDYHRPSDDVERLNSAGLTQLARMTAALVWDAASAPTLPAFRAAATHENQGTRSMSERALAPPPGRLGVQLNSPPDQPPRISGVTPGSPASRAGLRPGDVIHQVAGRPVESLLAFQELVYAATSPVRLQIARGTSRSEVSVETSVAPTRWGLTWKYDDAEPGVLIVVRVVPGAPAHRAGIQPLDRLTGLNGTSFATGDELAQALRQATGDVTLEYERRGAMAMVVARPLTIVDGQGSDLPTAASSIEAAAPSAPPPAPPAPPGTP